MKKIKLQKIGKLIKTHGVHGNLLLTIDSNISSELLEQTILDDTCIFLEINGIPVPFHVEDDSVREFSNNSFLLKLSNIDTNEAKKMCPSNVFVNIAYVEGNINIEDDYNSISNFDILDRNLGTVGKVEYLLDIKENPIIATNYNDKEVLIPLKSDYILNIDFEKQVVYTDFPENYLEMLA